MKNMRFIQIQKDNEIDLQQLLNMWIPYLREIDFNNTESDTELSKYACQRVNIQGMREDMHFELCFDDNNLVGFAFYAVDLGGIKNIIEPGFGYIMEFYVLPQYRRQGYGKKIFEHIEKTFFSHGTKCMYLTPQKVSGEPFWSSLGFMDSGKIDPDNQMPIYIKKVV